MKVELTVNGGLLNGKLRMSNTQRHELECAKDPSRRVRAWVRRYAAEMGYAAPDDDAVLDTACKAANGVITVSALPVSGNGNGKPQGTRKARATCKAKNSGKMNFVRQYASPELAATAEQIRHERHIRHIYADLLIKACEYERKATLYKRFVAAYGERNAAILSSNSKARKCGRIAGKAYAVAKERRARDIELSALIAEQTAAIAAKDTARLADISARIAAIVAA